MKNKSRTFMNVHYEEILWSKEVWDLLQEAGCFEKGAG